jgi:hypothetical protein
MTSSELEDNKLVVDIVQKPIAIDSLMTKVAQSIWSEKWFYSSLLCSAVRNPESLMGWSALTHKGRLFCFVLLVYEMSRNITWV